MITNDARREFFRVSVPESENMTLATDSETYRVAEISERGIRIESSEALAIDQWIQGTITYDQDKSFEVAGKVIRIAPSGKSKWTVVVAEPLNLSMPHVIAFQSYLVRKYGRPERQNGARPT
jgi:hypothetical protein